VTISFKDIGDDWVKFELTNTAVLRRATMDTFMLAFQEGSNGLGFIREIKLGGTVLFKYTDSVSFPNGVGSGDTVESSDWTNTNQLDRQLDPGEALVVLEVKFTQKKPSLTEADFMLTLMFEEDCSQIYGVPQARRALRHR
jgi:hypothetical protein